MWVPELAALPRAAPRLTRAVRLRPPAPVAMALQVEQSEHPGVQLPGGLWQLVALARRVVKVAPLAEVPPATPQVE